METLRLRARKKKLLIDSQHIEKNFGIANELLSHKRQKKGGGENCPYTRDM